MPLSWRGLSSRHPKESSRCGAAGRDADYQKHSQFEINVIHGNTRLCAPLSLRQLGLSKVQGEVSLGVEIRELINAIQQITH
jgi:hypothetical protein